MRALDEVIYLQSELNENMCMIFVPLCVVSMKDFTDRVVYLYQHWFEVDDDDKFVYYSPIGDYIVSNLYQAGYKLGRDYKMFFDAEWDDL